jgi:hypothetical protein
MVTRKKSAISCQLSASLGGKPRKENPQRNSFVGFYEKL